MYNVFIFVRTGLFWLWIDLRCECAFFEAFVDILFLFFDNFFYFIFHPNSISLQKSGMTGYEVPFILLDHRFEGTLNIYFVFGQLMFLHEFLLGFSSFIVQIFPNRFDIIFVWVVHSFGWTVLMRRRCSEFLLSVFFRGKHYLVIGLKVLLLIKIHFLLSFINFIHLLALKTLLGLIFRII